MEPLSEVRWGIIGCGDVCEVKSAPAMQQLPHSSIVAVMRRNGDKAADYARRHGVPRWYADAGDLLADPEVNAVYIATPPGSHAEYTVRAARAGKPVYVEKPMARTYAECRQMIDACREAGVPLYVAYYRRTLVMFQKVKKWIDDGRIGAVRFVNIQLIQPRHPALIADSEENWRVLPEIAGGGYFYDLASHQLDYLDFLFGPIAAVKGLKANQAGLYPAEDIVAASFAFENGVIGSGLWCFTAASSARKEEITIVGDRGTITFPTFGAPRARLVTDEPREQICKVAHPPHIQQLLIEQVVDALRGGRDSVVSTGETAARTNWVMEQIININS